MLISQALAATEAAAPAATTAAMPAAPSAGDAFLTNMGLIVAMFILFYVLLIRPQQKRLKAQQAMLSALKVGDRVVTGAGFIGTISALKSDSEVEVDLGNGFKVTALRYSISTVANDQQKAA
ncbi:MAG: preprotein translocase subunit YajC [Alphaproteobacteria bacterium]|nr:preprotein translocase subunit YajC [Alphaproteobacteria bacterium]